MTVFEPFACMRVLAFSFQGIMVSPPLINTRIFGSILAWDRPGCKPEPNVFLALGKNTVERAEGLSLYRANKSVEETGNGSVPGIGSAQAEAEAMPAIAPVREYGVAKRPSGPKEGVNWRGLAQQSGLFLGVQHAFRLATEPGTREGLKGPFWKGYAQAVGNLHGWSDGDPYYVNYLGHPLEGAVAGFIWIGNDRRLPEGRVRQKHAVLEEQVAGGSFSPWLTARSSRLDLSARRPSGKSRITIRSRVLLIM
jgi:hypothetical protein